MESVPLCKGKKYVSFKAVEEDVQLFEERNYIELCRRDSRTLISASKKYPLRIAASNKQLVYYSITFSCYKGGKPYKQENGKTFSRKRSTRKENCPMFVRLALSEDGQCLYVAEENLVHSHITDKESFQFIPKQRRLDAADKEEVINLLNLHCNKKLVKKFIKTKYGKVLNLRDLTNLKSSNKQTSDTELKDVVEYLQSHQGSTVEVLVDTNDILEGIFFQDLYMKNNFKSYPELILCDATYKLNNLGMPLYILLVINGNGRGGGSNIYIK